jgi:hypothetical protein
MNKLCIDIASVLNTDDPWIAGALNEIRRRTLHEKLKLRDLFGCGGGGNSM